MVNLIKFEVDRILISTANKEEKCNLITKYSINTLKNYYVVIRSNQMRELFGDRTIIRIIRSEVRSEAHRHFKKFYII